MLGSVGRHPHKYVALPTIATGDGQATSDVKDIADERPIVNADVKPYKEAAHRAHQIRNSQTDDQAAAQNPSRFLAAVTVANREGPIYKEPFPAKHQHLVAGAAPEKPGPGPGYKEALRLTNTEPKKSMQSLLAEQHSDELVVPG